MRGRPRTELSASDKKFIDKNHNLTYVELMDKLNLFSVHKVREYCQAKGYKKPLELTEEQKDFIRSNYQTMTERNIAKSLGVPKYHVQKLKSAEGLKRHTWTKEPEDEVFFNVEKRWSWVA